VRTCKAAEGGFTIDAELVGLKPGDIVRLKAKDGREIEVPLAQLSEADRDYVKNPPKAGAISPKFAKAQRAADRCRLPDEALVVYQVFHDDPQTAPAEKAQAAARIAELKELSARKMVRLNKKWVPAAEAEAVRKQADELMRQGLELLRLENETAFRQKFQAATALEPEEIRAEFLAAVIFTAARAGDKAIPLFQKCLARDPENIAVLNNLALLSVAKADWNSVSSYWRRALELQPDQRVVHNIGRFLEQCTESNINITKSARDSLSLPYAELVASGKFASTEPEVGWLFLLIEASALDIDFRTDDEEKPKDVMPAATEDGPVVGGGTGFVVHPGHVLTNAHVAQDNATFEIQLSDGKLLKATRVAKADKADLALLKCEELSAPPLALAPTTVPRGTDVMLLGYPEMTTLGASLKAARGSISSVPDAAANDRYLYDAVTNAGNSGGPVCDDKGNVIAVHYLGVNTASRYGGGIPSPKALEFLNASLPGFKAIEAHTERLDWPAVDAAVGPSTVLIWVRKKNARAATSKIGSDLIELPICLFCSGVGDLRCAFPGCAKGQVTRNGNRSDCPSCNGKGTVECKVCSGVGIDVQLASVQNALDRIRAAKSGGANPATPAPPANAPRGGQRVDLLAMIDLSKHVVNGPWSRDGSRLVGGGVNASRVQIPYEPPPEYDVFVQAQMTKTGDGGLIMGLVSSGRQFYVAVREDGGGISAGGIIGNEYEVKNLRLPVTTSMTFQYSVRRDAITVRANGNRVLEYRDSQGKLSLNSTMTMPNRRQLFIGSGGPVQWSISSISLVPITSQQSAAPATAAAASNSSPVVSDYNGHRYSFVMGRISWTAAKERCEQMGGYLACITTPDEQAFLVNSLPRTATGPAEGKFWIGGFLRDGRWQWLSGESFSYSPNGPAADPQEPYLRLLSNTNRWLGEQDNTSLIQGFICEWNQ
jgi:S1-C subfamily serine protease